MNTKAAMEMSVGTIVTIVLLMSVLIFGMIFVKNIMCSGISITNGIDEKLQNEIQTLFGTSDYGVKCMGENGQEVTIGDGGKRQIFCVINTDTQTTYNLNVVKVESLSGESTANVQKWILPGQDWTGPVSPGRKTATVLILNIPKSTSATSLKITLKESIAGTSTEDIHLMYIDVKHVGQVTSTIC